MKLYSEQDANPAIVRSAPVAVIGYGSQGRAHALNLKSSGVEVIVGLRKGAPTAQRATADGLEVASLAEATRQATLIAILTPDMTHEKIFAEDVAPNLKDGDALLFAHGFTVLYGRVTPPKNVDVIMVAPKAPAISSAVNMKRAAACLASSPSIRTPQARRRKRRSAMQASSAARRRARSRRPFREETETDLFGEQAVLCGGATELVMAGYETLVDAGYKPEVAYYECLHELKLIVDLLYEGGVAKMHQFVSETAKYGDLVSGPRVINAETRARMREVLGDIQSGAFARDWILENQAGKPRYSKLLEKDLAHPIEKTGADLRARMAWLKPGANTKDA